MKNVSSMFKQQKTFKRTLLFEGILVGVLAGLIAVLYRYMLTYSEKALLIVIKQIKENFLYCILWFICLMFIAYIVIKLVNNCKDISGSGIPQIEAEVGGHIDQKWYKVILSKMVGGSLSVFAGLSLGREGPSIQLGGLIGKGIAKSLKRIKIEERYLIICGAAAGLSAAFNAPLAGVMFALEEIHKNFSVTALMSVMCASITGDFISKQFFGLQPVFNFPILNTLPLTSYHYIFLLGIVMGLIGAFYNYILKFFHKIYKRFPLKNNKIIYIPFVISFILCLYYPVVLGGGHQIIHLLEHGNIAISILLMMLVVKFLFSHVSFCSGAPGGIFFPLLVIGSLIGAIFSQVLITYFGVDSLYFNNFIILAMVGFFSSIVRAPITGIILVAEMSGSLKQMLPIAFVAFIAYIVADYVKSQPVYDYLTERLLDNQNMLVSKQFNNKDIRSYIIQIGSLADNKYLKDLSMPDDFLVVSVKRGENEFIARGNIRLHAGDYVSIIANKTMFIEKEKVMTDLFFYKDN